MPSENSVVLHLSSLPGVVVSKDLSTDEGVKVLLRVRDLVVWNRAVLKFLRAAAEDPEESFGISVRKEYFLAEGAPTFSWVFVAWGDSDAVADAVGDVVTSLNRAPAVPAAVDAPVEKLKNIRADFARNSKGDLIEYRTIPFKHVKDKDRNRPGRRRPDGSLVQAFVEHGIVSSVDFRTGTVSKETL